MADFPINAAFFKVEFGSKVKGYFREMSGLGSEHEVTQQKAVDKAGNVVWFQIPGNIKWAPVTLKQGIVSGQDSLSLWDWRQEIVNGKFATAKTNGSIVMLSQDKQEVARWEFIAAWPSKITGPAPNASSNDIAIEEMQIVYDSFTRKK
jgi:phage tail-like protein